MVVPVVVEDEKHCKEKKLKDSENGVKYGQEKWDKNWKKNYQEKNLEDEVLTACRVDGELVAVSLEVLTLSDGRGLLFIFLF